MNLELLITVERAVPLETVGITVMPEAPASAATFPTSRTMPVELRRPDGSNMSVMATLQWTHLDSGGYRLMCVLLGVETKQVPAGTQIWCPR